MRSILGILVLVLAPPALAEEPADARQLSESCRGCHGAELEGSGVLSGLRGRPAGELGSALTALKADQAEGSVMNRIAASLSAGEIEAVSRLIAEGN